MHSKARCFAGAAGESLDGAGGIRPRQVAIASLVAAALVGAAVVAPGVAVVIAVALAAAYALCVLASVCFGGWVHHSLVVDAPVEAVWNYGSDSTRASEWSVYFDHIVPIEGEGIAPDGTVGAYRICFRTADRTGPRWAETTEAATPFEHREIHTFDLRGFQFGALAKHNEYEVHQDYEAIDDSTSRLTFRSRLRRAEGLFALVAFPVLKATYMVLAREAGQQVFVWNLENIAAAVAARHAGVPYERPHPWAPSLGWEDQPLRWWIRCVLLRRRPRSPHATLRSARA